MWNGTKMLIADESDVVLATLDFDVGKVAYVGVGEATGYMYRWAVVDRDGVVASGRVGDAFNTRICIPDTEFHLGGVALAGLEADCVRGLDIKWHWPASQHASLDALPEPPPQPVYDLSPLANLATAVAWGMALERVVTEWRAWHPAARVSWDLEPGMNGAGSTSIRVSYSIDGIGHVLCAITDLGGRTRWGALADVAKDAKVRAALAMAPHYVAPTPKPANRDAALRRFADGVSR